MLSVRESVSILKVVTYKMVVYWVYKSKLYMHLVIRGFLDEY